MQFIIALVLIVLGVVLFLAKKYVKNEDLERAANVGGILMTIAGLIVLAFYTATLGSKDERATATPPKTSPSISLPPTSTQVKAPTMLAEASTATPTWTSLPSPSATAENCYDSNMWTPYEKDSRISLDGNCWLLTGWGYYVRNSEILIVPTYPSNAGQFHGIYAPIGNASEISFTIRVDKFVVDEGRTANIGIGIINLDPPGPATSRLVFYHYIPRLTTRYLHMKTGIDAEYKDGIAAALVLATPQKVLMRVDGPLFTMIFDDSVVVELTLPFEKRAFWISYSIPIGSQLKMSIYDLKIE